MAPHHGATTLLKQSKDYEAYCNLEKRPIDIPIFKLGNTTNVENNNKGRTIHPRYVTDKHYGEIFCRMRDPKTGELCLNCAPMQSTSLRKHVLDDHEVEWEEDPTKPDKGGKRSKEEIKEAMKFYRDVMFRHRDQVDDVQDILDANNVKLHEHRKREAAEEAARAKEDAEEAKRQAELKKTMLAKAALKEFGKAQGSVSSEAIDEYLRRDWEHSWPIKKRPANAGSTYVPSVHKTQAKTRVLGMTGKTGKTVRQVCDNCKENMGAKTCDFEGNRECALYQHYGPVAVALAAHQKVLNGEFPDGEAQLDYPGAVV